MESADETTTEMTAWPDVESRLNECPFVMLTSCNDDLMLKISFDILSYSSSLFFILSIKMLDYLWQVQLKL